MSALWDFFWPCIAAGILTGGLGGLFGFRRKRRTPILVGLLLALASAPAWLGPLGAADRFTARVERQAREALNHYELQNVTAHLHRAPLTRQLVLAGGQLDDWQRREVARLFGEVPGVSSATWSESDAGLPLILEAAIAAIIGFLLGLLLAYLLELRRRYNAQWTW
jgi:hypothetical protein